MGIELEQAKAEYMNTIEGEGGDCPCCGRFGKVNAYSLNSGMAVCLIWLYKWHQKNGPDRFCHLPTQADRSVLTCNSTGKLRHWGLVDRANSCNTSKPKSGSYRLTRVGRLFVTGDGLANMPRRVFVWNDEYLDATNDDRISIKEALGSKFDYEEMMKITYKGMAA